MAFVSIQALCHLGFAWVAWTSHRGLWLFLMFKCLFWVSGMQVVPAWGAWMGSLTQGAHRERYFALRSSLVQVALLISFCVAGEVLQRGRDGRQILLTAAGLMLVSLVARLCSALVLAAQADPDAPTLAAAPRGHFREVLRSSGWRVASYIALLGFGVYIAVPFFTPYMLRELHLDVREFTLLSAMSILCKALVFPLGHHISARVGLRAVLAWGGLGVAMIPLLWALGPSFGQLLWIHVLGGVAWAAVEYASFQLLLGSSEPRLAVDFLALAGALQGGLQLAGSLVGGLLLDRTGAEHGHVFILSAVGRALPLMLLVTLPLARLRVLPNLAYRLLGVVPVIGPRFRPLLPEVDGTRDEAERLTAAPTSRP